MKSILIFSLFLFSLSNFKNDNQNKRISGKYRVEFRNNSSQNFIIDFQENEYTKTNFKEETIGKGKIEKNVNETDIVLLKNYIINNKTTESNYMQIWFTQKDTLYFGIYRDNEPHFSTSGGILVKIKN